MRKSVRSLAIAGVAGVAVLTALGVAGGPALAGGPSSPSVSFSSSNDGASAGWSAGVGSAIDLTLGSSPSTFARADVHYPATTVNGMTEPTFSTNNYNAGSPRFYLTLNNHDTVVGYPSNAGLNGTDMAWAVNNGNTYESWDAVQASESGAKITGISVIADGDQTPGTTDQITALWVGGVRVN